MKPLKADFEKLVSQEDVLCVKTIVNINFETQFLEDKLQSCFVPMSKVISVYRESMALNLLNK